MTRRALTPLAVALLGLAGALAATLALHRAAREALDRVQEERLRGAGETAVLLLGGAPPTEAQLRSLVEAGGLDGAYVVDPSLAVVADAAGAAGARLDPLRADVARVKGALAGEVSVGHAWDLGDLAIQTAYFPLRGAGGVQGVLALEAGKTFSAARAGLRRALAIGVGLACAGAVAVFGLALGARRAERREQAAAEAAARGAAVARMAAAVAHEIRNPLGIIRGAVELLRERAGAGLAPRDRQRLEDVLGEVGRLRALTEDFLDLAADRPLQAGPVDLAALAADAARGSRALHPELDVWVSVGPSTVLADPGRLRQVLGNLLANAAQAGARRVELRGGPEGDRVRLIVADDGPGIPAEVRARLFEPFASARPGGTGLGLAVSRRIAERHGGALELAAEGPGAIFELTLPRG